MAYWFELVHFDRDELLQVDSFARVFRYLAIVRIDRFIFQIILLFVGLDKELRLVGQSVDLFLQL